MQKEIQKIIITDFLQNLDNTKDISNNPISVIMTSTVEEIRDFIPNEFSNETRVLNITPELNEHEFLQNLYFSIDAKFVFLNILGEIPPHIYSQLSQLSKEGFMTYSTLGSATVNIKKLQSDTNIVLIGTRTMLEKQHGNILNLANQLIDLEKEENA